MVPDRRMCLVHATVDLPVEIESGPDSGSERHVNQSSSVLTSAPACLSKSSGVGIVLDGHLHWKGSTQICHRILSLPMGKEIDISELACQRVHGSSRSNPDARNLCVCGPRCSSEHLSDASQRLCITAIGVRRTFQTGHDFAVAVDHSNCDLGSTNINRSDQSLLLFLACVPLATSTRRPH